MFKLISVEPPHIPHLLLLSLTLSHFPLQKSLFADFIMHELLWNQYSFLIHLINVILSSLVLLQFNFTVL